MDSNHEQQSLSTLGATSANPTAVVYTDLVNLYGSLDNLYVQNASGVMSSQTRTSLMVLISTTGQPILQADVNGNPFNAIFGRPIVIDESRPAITATNKAILFGDLKAGYTARKAGDFGINASLNASIEERDGICALLLRR
jgi:HK97 family phage major capsid protein